MIAKQHKIKSLSSLWSSSASLLSYWQGKLGKARTMTEKKGRWNCKYNSIENSLLRSGRSSWHDENYGSALLNAPIICTEDLARDDFFYFRSHCTNAQRAVSALRKLICGLIQQKCPYIQNLTICFFLDLKWFHTELIKRPFKLKIRKVSVIPTRPWMWNKKRVL